MAAAAVIHQAIFGYDAGHNLLSSSCQLAPESRRLLAVLTDASGPWPASGFERVFTGTPLPDMPFYALFCTWPAPEMPRPGCVWSHVLLIDLADLASLKNLDELQDYFKKPTDFDKQKYSDPLFPPSKSVRTSDIISASKLDCERLLLALYGMPESPCVIQAPDSRHFEDLVFALWSQQWPRLRRNFRFSTGSFSDRGRSGAAFDLQIYPESSRREPLKNNDTQARDADGWIRLAVDDLLKPDAKKFRSFLNAYGTDTNSPRSAFAKLAAAFELVVLKPDADWKEKLRAVGKLFPEKAEAVLLKEKLIGSEDLDHAWESADFLLSSNEASAFSNVSFDHAGLAPLLWKNKREKMLSLIGQLLRKRENSAASAFVQAVAKTVQTDELKFVSDKQPELIPIFLNYQPALAFDSITWELPSHIQWQINEALEKLSLEQEDWGKILAAKFIAATTVAVEETVKKAGGFAFAGALSWLDRPLAQEVLPSEGWRRALANSAVERLSKPEILSPAALAFCAWFVPSETIRKVLTASRQDVQQLARHPLDQLPGPLKIRTAFLLVTLGLRSTGPEGVKPLLRGYFEVYDALATNNYPWESWSLLVNELPQPGWWRDWDLCERLRQAVREWLFKHVKTGNPLLEAASSKKHSEIARKTLSEENSEDRFID
jgi:hypothetical protein